MNKLTKFSRTILAIAMMLCVALPTLAHDFEVDGIYYNYLDETAKTVEVTYKGSYSSDYSNEYTGSVTIPSSVTYSGTTYSVTSIGSYAFYGSTGLTSITIPNSVTSIGYEAFYECSGLTEVNISDLSAWCKIDFSDSNANPLSYAKKFKLNGAEIKDLVIPNDITKIKNYAFYNCTGLTSVTIPNSVTEIGSYAFEGCSSLTTITIPNSVTSIGSYAFEGTAWYNNHADGVIYINNVLYRYKGSMPNGTSISVKDGTVSISPYAFEGCRGLTSITIPNSVTEIGSAAFYNFTGLTSITIPNSVTSIGSFAFEDCTGLTSITIPNSVTEIGHYAFYDCTGLTSITIPNSVTGIGFSAFYGCTGLTEVNFNAENCTSMGSSSYPVFSGCTNIKTLNVGNEVKSIPSHAFDGCSGLTSITIPNSVTSIGSFAFEDCTGLTSVTIGNSVTSIGKEAFDCDNLRIVKSLSNTPQQCDDYAFGKNPAALLMVPKGSMMSYMIADGWRHFTKIQEFEVEDAVKPVLTIAYPEGGVIKQKVDNGTILELQIVPTNGWKCNSVTFNGVDVTNNLDADGNYNTPSITADSQLSIVFVKDAVGVESTLANAIKVCVNGNTVTILGADEFDDVEIYNTSGINVYNGIEKSITLDSNGIYILTVEGQTFKFAM